MTRYILNVCVHVALPKDKFIHTHHNLVNQQELCCPRKDKQVTHPAAKKPTAGGLALAGVILIFTHTLICMLKS